MRLIITHEQPDFDALASLALAKLVFPGSFATVQGGLGDGVRTFIHLYRDQLELLEVDQIDLAEISELVVVDTADRTRIKPFDELIGKVPITLYDHHPRPGNAIPAARGLVEQVGATATLLTRQLRTRGIEVSPSLASLALLGIHEDTGNLSYELTKPDDYEAAAYLLRCGASLELVQKFTREVYRTEHRTFQETMLEHAREITLAGHHLVVSSFHYPQYLPGVSSLCSQLLTLFSADAALLVVRMGEKTLLFGRAHQNFDVAAAFAEAFGGGGHPGAAFAKADVDPDTALETALETMERYAVPVLTAATLMSHPVKTIRDDATVTEAQRLLIHYGHNGVPVIDKEEQLVGILSRRDLERALRHGLGRSSVVGFMSRDIITADEGSTLAELEELVMTNNVGRLPIMRGNELVGIVTRTDLIAARHETKATQIPSDRVLSRLPTMVLDVLAKAAEAAPDTAIYLVGGTVRDALLGTGLQDLDLVLEAGNAQRLGRILKSSFGGRLNCHQGFGTCTLVLPSGLVIDLATAREEYYRHPGALPTVTPSTLRKDLSRRDFTVNALALRFHPKPATLLDPYGGLADMEEKELKLLHPLSFIEDPTRILRGARLAGRLGFHFDDITLQRAKAALIPEVLDKVSRERLRSELELCCQEPRPGPALFYLEEIGALGAMFNLSVDRQLLLTLDELAQQIALPGESCLLALLLRLEDDRVGAHFEAFRWPKRYLQARGRLLDIERRELVRDEDLERLGEAGRAVVKAFGPELRARVTAFEKVPRRRKLRGQDVLDLGLASGPEVGKVLEEVARARAAQRVHTFEEELELARNLIAELPALLHSEE